jgi:probable O-glycosylation ligase (exosortase A-associated)
MREAALIGIVAAICVVALVKPRIGLLGYTWFALMRPDALSWSVGRPYSLCLAACTLIGSVIYLPRFVRIVTNPISRGLVLLLVPLTISADLAVDPSLSWPSWNYFIRIVVMALLIVVFVDEEKQLRTLLFIVAVSIGFLGLKLGLYGFLVGRAEYMDDLEGTLMSDNNMLALALAMVVPLCWYGRSMVQSRLLRLTCLVLMFGSIAGIVMTNSRGGALSLGAVLVVIALRANRKLAAVAVILICTAPAVYVVGHAYIARLSTITANESEADHSIRSRLDHQRAAFAMWKDYPMFGVGFGMFNYANLAPRYLGYKDNHVAHNTYFQFLADDGIFAFLIYVSLLFGTILWLEKSGRFIRDAYPGKEVYPFAIEAALIAFSVGSFFLSRDSYDLLYIMLMSAAAWRTVERVLVAEAQETIEADVEEQPAGMASA